MHDCPGSGVSVVETHSGIEPIVQLQGAPGLAARLAADPGWALVFNGSYHDGHYGSASLVGGFVVQGRVLSPLHAADAQLSQVVRLDGQGRIASITDLADAGDQPAANGTAFQTGPLILDAGRVAQASIAASLNGSDAYKRTALGRTADGTTVVAIARRPRTLAAFAADVLAAGDLAHRGLTLVNLDGGFSTAWALADQPASNYQPDKQTPVAFGVRRDACVPDRPEWLTVAGGHIAVSRTPVTVCQWQRCIADGGCGGYGPHRQGRSADHPVVNVSVDDAQAYADWLRGTSGLPVRLVREDEWAQLVLAGAPGPYPWGAMLEPGRANCLGCGSVWDGIGTSPVGSFAPNALGLLDMAGNVAHWLAAPGAGSTVPPRCAAQPHTAAIGGASWADPPRFIAPDERSCVDRGLRDDTIGFRVAFDRPAPPDPEAAASAPE